MQKLFTMLNRIIIFPVFLMANFLIIVNSDTAGFRVSNFRAYGNVNFVGTLQNVVPAANKFKCIMDCASEISCQGFAYGGNSCIQSDRSSVLSIDFAADPGNSRIRRNVLLQDLNYHPVTLFMSQNVTLVNKLSHGNMIYLKAILLKHEDVSLEIYDNSNKKNITYHMRARCGDITYHMRARCGDGTCNDRFVVVDNRFNSNWNGTNYHGYSYTLVLNEVFEVHVLITANGIVTYLNRVFQFTLRIPLSALTATYVFIYGNMKVLELSL